MGLTFNFFIASVGWFQSGSLSWIAAYFGSAYARAHSLPISANAFVVWSVTCAQPTGDMQHVSTAARMPFVGVIVLSRCLLADDATLDAFKQWLPLVVFPDIVLAARETVPHLLYLAGIFSPIAHVPHIVRSNHYFRMLKSSVHVPEDVKNRRYRLRQACRWAARPW